MGIWGLKKIEPHYFREKYTLINRIKQIKINFGTKIARVIWTHTDVINMDFERAFDNVPYRRLLYRLSYNGISGSTHKLVSSLMSERSQKVEMGGQA